MITRGWRSVPTCDCGMDLRDHPATCVDPLTDPQSWWAPRKENGMAEETEEERIERERRGTDRLLEDLKNGK
jgi:hypothetical protein